MDGTIVIVVRDDDWRHGRRARIIDRKLAARRPGARPERYRRNMTLTNAAQRQDEPDRTIGKPRLIGMQNGAGIEERRCLVSVFLTKVGPDQALLLGRTTYCERNAVGPLAKPAQEGGIHVAVILVE